MPHYLAIQKVVRIFANNKEEWRIGMKNKWYTTDLEQIARFAKAMGHPTRMAILAFLAKQDSCFFGDIHEELPIAKATVSYCINWENWELARNLFAAFLGESKSKGTSCCE